MHTHQDHLRLLLIDDEKEFLNIFVRILPPSWIIDTFTNPKLALDHYSQNQNYDLVITDLNMGKKSGESLIFDIKYINPDQQVLVLTGNARGFNVPEKFDIRVFDKPMGYRALIQTLISKSIEKGESYRTPFSNVF